MKSSRLLLSAAVAVVVVVATGCSSSAKSSSAPASGTANTGGSASGVPPKLSLSTVTVAEGPIRTVDIADALGYYQQAGLTVKIQSITTAASNIQAAVIGGSADFGQLSAGVAATSMVNGAGVTAVMASNTSIDQQLYVSKSFAAAHNIPSTGTTESAAVQQMNALKGSHINIGFVNTTGDGYTYMMAFAKQYGLTVGGSGQDIQATTVGSVAAAVTAFQTGKVDAMVGIASQTTAIQSLSPASLNFWELPPASTALSQIVETSNSMLSAHPDTVQAFVTATVKAWDYATKNPDGAIKILTPLDAKLDITADQVPGASADVIQSHFAGPTPVVTNSAFNAMASVLNAVKPNSFTVPFATFANNTFAINAIKQLGLNYPTVTS